ncbi:uncharacterized protein isoform X2 [Leptinotarsa decemlineata]|uniref:uncharacterized protein isoform X2 n=1 Tax=Leptinotarsa decemlineata TaxID=7539 RepID=UPI000C254648|nr:uncharacterized protein LOC111506437 isoform X1 [Leptinotarsa decemlineata]
MNKFGICVVIVAIFGIYVYETKEFDLPFMNVYYDPITKRPMRVTSIENMLVNVTKSSTKTAQVKVQSKNIRRIGYRSNGCTCQELNCGCCLGINLNQFNFKREGCMNFTYDPNEFALTMNMFMNENSIYSNSFSAKNPPPLCLPVPVPYIPVQVQACAKLFNVFTPGRNLHMCFDFETRIQNAAILVLHFDCMRMGTDGIALVKPEDGGGLPISTPSTTTDGQIDADIYDDVTEIKKYISMDTVN